MKLNYILFFSLAGWIAPLAASTPPPPNVLFIAIDDLRPELGSYGSKQAKTPHVDKLAAGSLLFDRAYCQVPVCGASRASLLTGILPTSSRFVDYSSKAETDAPNAATLPEVFKNAGYTTISIGKIFHHNADTQNRSWSEPAWRPAPIVRVEDPDNKTPPAARHPRGPLFASPDVPDNALIDGQIAEKTIEKLRMLKEAGEPFFLACGFFKPHMPFEAPKKYWDLYDHDKIEIADNRYRPKNAPNQLFGTREYSRYDLIGFDVNSEAFHRMMRHGYLACTSYMDKLTGDVLAELDRLGLAENTIVVFWGDHGFQLGEHDFWGKHNTMHVNTRVPLIVRVPGKKADRTSSIVESSDIFPTLCSLAGLETPKTVQGRDFSALFDNPQEPFREVAYSRFVNGDAVITKGFSYTSYHGGKAHMLYDLEKDPHENINVADDPAYRDTLEKMSSMLKQREEEAARYRP